MRLWHAALVIAVVVGLGWADHAYLGGAVLYWLANALFDWINWIAFWR